MSIIHILAVGRLREPYWKEAAEEFAKRLGRSFDLRQTVVRDGKSDVSPREKTLEEGQALLQALARLKGVFPIALDERGRSMTSVEFASFLRRKLDAAQTPCFVIGGAYGLSPEVREHCPAAVSLSPLTFTHEMARVLLMEQLYRADSILRNRPYHHA